MEDLVTDCLMDSVFRLRRTDVEDIEIEVFKIKADLCTRVLKFILKLQDRAPLSDKESVRHCFSSFKGPSVNKDRKMVFDDYLTVWTSRLALRVTWTGSIDQRKTLINTHPDTSGRILIIVRKGMKMSTSPSRIPTPPSRLPTPSPTLSTQSKNSSPPSQPRVQTPGTSNTSSSKTSKSPSPSSSAIALSGKAKQQDEAAKVTVTSSVIPRVEDAGQNSDSRYITVHMGEPCTIGALGHLLICGHKVMTAQAETCASNCQQPHLSDRNPRGLDESFTCMTCITKHLQQKHAERVASFRAELEVVAKTTGKRNPHEWMAQKLEFMEVAWKDLEVTEMETLSKIGRFCHAIYVDEDYQELANLVMKQRQSSAHQSESEARVELTTAQESKTTSSKSNFPEELGSPSPTPKAAFGSRFKMSSKLPSLRK